MNESATKVLIRALENFSRELQEYLESCSTVDATEPAKAPTPSKEKPKKAKTKSVKAVETPPVPSLEEVMEACKRVSSNVENGNGVIKNLVRSHGGHLIKDMTDKQRIEFYRELNQLDK